MLQSMVSPRVGHDLAMEQQILPSILSFIQLILLIAVELKLFSQRISSLHGYSFENSIDLKYMLCFILKIACSIFSVCVYIYIYIYIALLDLYLIW